MRQPKPWYWRARKAWYVQIGGKQVRLHENEKEAHREYHRRMAGGGAADDQARSGRVGEAVAAFCVSKKSYRASTRRLYSYHLQPFCDEFAARRLDSIRPDEVINFITGYRGSGMKGKTFSDATRYISFRFVKTFFRWARDVGLIQYNHFASAPNPWRQDEKGRQRAMTEGEYQAVMGTRRISPQFQEVLECLYRTGARPGEIACLSARHLDPKLPIARLAPSEYKTGGRTGLQREIHFPQDLMDRLREKAKTERAGPLLRTRKGTPWTQGLISCYFQRVRERLGLDPDLVIYMARHSYATRLLSNGVRPAIAAKLLGHTGTSTIQRVYYHPDTFEMISAVEGTSGSGLADVGKIREDVETARRDFRQG